MSHKRIDIDPKLSIGNALLEAVDHFAIGRASLIRLDDATQQMVDPGPPPDYARIAQEYGCSAADAEALYNLILGSTAEFETPTNLSQLIDRVDQG